jgi:excinuclease ABC subunit C
LLLLQHPVEDKAAISGWLQGKSGSRVRLEVPQRGERKQLVDTVVENAHQSLLQHRLKQTATASAIDTALDEIAKELKLSGPPQRMEGYDISNIQGKDAVGSMVVFEAGKPCPAHYRRFRIKTVPGADDFAMLQEVIKRRFGRINKDSEDASNWAVLPDLVLIDGGKGQLSSVVEVMHEVGADAVPIIGLAKQREEIFLPRRSQPVRLPYSSPGLQLLQRLRDEAHRFALSYHHKMRRRRTFSSALDTVPGVGPKLRHSLLKQFGSLPAIKEASADQLAATKGVSLKLANKIKEHLS